MKVFILISVMLFGIQNNICAQETAKLQQTKQAKQETAAKDITGTVGGISPNFIAVTLGRGAQGQAALEMAFNLNKTVKIEHKNSIKDIKLGDTVQVAYDEITTTREDGSKSIRRVAKSVIFLRQAENKPETGQANQLNGVLESRSDQDSLPLNIKGPKER